MELSDGVTLGGRGEVSELRRAATLVYNSFEGAVMDSCILIFGLGSIGKRHFS